MMLRASAVHAGLRGRWSNNLRRVLNRSASHYLANDVELKVESLGARSASTKPSAGVPGPGSHQQRSIRLSEPAMLDPDSELSMVREAVTDYEEGARLSSARRPQRASARYDADLDPWAEEASDLRATGRPFDEQGSGGALYHSRERVALNATAGLGQVAPGRHEHDPSSHGHHGDATTSRMMPSKSAGEGDYVAIWPWPEVDSTACIELPPDMHGAEEIASARATPAASGTRDMPAASGTRGSQSAAGAAAGPLSTSAGSAVCEPHDGPLGFYDFDPWGPVEAYDASVRPSLENGQQEPVAFRYDQPQPQSAAVRSAEQQLSSSVPHVLALAGSKLRSARHAAGVAYLAGQQAPESYGGVINESGNVADAGEEEEEEDRWTADAPQVSPAQRVATDIPPASYRNDAVDSRSEKVDVLGSFDDWTPAMDRRIAVTPEDVQKVHAGSGNGGGPRAASGGTDYYSDSGIGGAAGSGSAFGGQPRRSLHASAHFAGHERQVRHTGLGASCGGSDSQVSFDPAADWLPPFNQPKPRVWWKDTLPHDLEIEEEAQRLSHGSPRGPARGYHLRWDPPSEWLQPHNQPEPRVWWKDPLPPDAEIKQEAQRLAELAGMREPAEALSAGRASSSSGKPRWRSGTRALHVIPYQAAASWLLPFSALPVRHVSALAGRGSGYLADSEGESDSFEVPTAAQPGGGGPLSGTKRAEGLTAARSLPSGSVAAAAPPSPPQDPSTSSGMSYDRRETSTTGAAGFTAGGYVGGFDADPDLEEDVLYDVDLERTGTATSAAGFAEPLGPGDEVGAGDADISESGGFGTVSPAGYVSSAAHSASLSGGMAPSGTGGKASPEASYRRRGFATLSRLLSGASTASSATAGGRSTGAGHGYVQPGSEGVNAPHPNQPLPPPPGGEAAP